jgi:subtilisin family serine protease
VAAAGNNGKQEIRVECPAIYDSPIAVAAVKQNSDRLETSAMGRANELSAPGENVFGISPNKTIVYGNGTSFAVPYVVGTAALIWEKNRTLTNAQLRDVICHTATDKGTPGRNTLYGWGIVNATAAIQAVSDNINTTNPTNPPNPTTNPTNPPNPTESGTNPPNQPTPNTNSYITIAIIGISGILITTTVIFSVTRYYKNKKTL